MPATTRRVLVLLLLWLSECRWAGGNLASRRLTWDAKYRLGVGGSEQQVVVCAG